MGIFWITSQQETFLSIGMARKGFDQKFTINHGYHDITGSWFKRPVHNENIPGLNARFYHGVSLDAHKVC